MRRTVVGLVVLGVLALAVPVQAAGGVKYKGKTSSGHPITFVLKGKKLHDMRSGISVQCISIQGGGAPTGGVDTFSYDGWAPMRANGFDFTFMKKPAFHYNEVTTKHTLSSKLNRRTGAITGTQRIQYSFLIPKYPIGTFVIYSCLGSGEFKAKPLKRGG
jgi:hypothetical protein